MESNCRRWTAEIVERARIGLEPGADLRVHLRECSGCRERREDERRLTMQIRMAREAAHIRPPVEERRKLILSEFEAARRRSIRPSLRWALATAAIVLLAIGLVDLRRGGTRGTSNAPPAAALQETADDSLPADSNGFIAVPYAPPLATGEFVSVVRTELQPTALARMGIYVDAGYATDIAADVVVGEDGLPRAVRWLTH